MAIRKKIETFLQVQTFPVSQAEKHVSALGGFVGIVLVLAVSQAIAVPIPAALIVASMGASAVLLFAVPHGALSQPWPLVGGHLVAAIIGVCCAKLIPVPFVAAAAAVGLAIAAMHLLRCIHPPGGATALTAVIGGDAIHALGFQFLLTPVLLNVAIILAVAVVFNYPFRWRRYPVGWARIDAEKPRRSGAYPDISHADFVAALSEIDSVIDVTEQDLLRIYDVAMRAHKRRPE